MEKKKICVGLLAGMLALSVTSCGGQTEETVSSIDKQENMAGNVTEPTEGTEVIEDTEVTEAPTVSVENVESEGKLEDNKGQLEENETPEPAQKINAEGNQLLEELSKWSFYFSSGAGGWGTSLDINEDGSFYGIYSDSDMGDTGKGYPNGTIYYCQYSGQFTEPIKVNDYTYSVKIKEINFAQKKDTKEIRSGNRYIYSSVYGLDGADEIYIYTPNALVNKLPKEYMSWVYREEEATSTLGFYGLYNIAEQCGFTSWKSSEGFNHVKAQLQEVKKKADQIEYQLEKEAQTQLEMNQLSGELYQLWDDELNAIWKEMQSCIDKETMNYYTTEEREWIKAKEKAVKKAGEMYEGGSMQPLEENLKAADLTKIRVYELVNILRNYLR